MIRALQENGVLHYVHCALNCTKVLVLILKAIQGTEFKDRTPKGPII